ASGAGRVNDRCEVVGPDRLQISIKRSRTLLRQLAPALFELFQRKAVFDVFGDFRFEEDQMLQWSFREHRQNVFVKPSSGNEYGSRAGVGKNVIDLLERLGRVNGNIDRSQTQNGEIGNGPLGTILGKQCDSIARANTESSQSERHVFDSLDKLCRGDVVPLAVAAVIES